MTLHSLFLPFQLLSPHRSSPSSSAACIHPARRVTSSLSKLQRPQWRTSYLRSCQMWSATFLRTSALSVRPTQRPIRWRRSHLSRNGSSSSRHRTSRTGQVSRARRPPTRTRSSASPQAASQRGQSVACSIGPRNIVACLPLLSLCADLAQVVPETLTNPPAPEDLLASPPAMTENASAPPASTGAAQPSNAAQAGAAGAPPGDGPIRASSSFQPATVADILNSGFAPGE